MSDNDPQMSDAWNPAPSANECALFLSEFFHSDQDNELTPPLLQHSDQTPLTNNIPSESSVVMDSKAGILPAMNMDHSNDNSTSNSLHNRGAFVAKPVVPVVKMETERFDVDPINEEPPSSDSDTITMPQLQNEQFAIAIDTGAADNDDSDMFADDSVDDLLAAAEAQIHNNQTLIENLLQSSARSSRMTTRSSPMATLDASTSSQPLDAVLPDERNDVADGGDVRDGSFKIVDVDEPRQNETTGML